MRARLFTTILSSLALTSCADFQPRATFDPATGRFIFTAEYQPAPVVEPSK